MNDYYETAPDPESAGYARGVRDGRVRGAQEARAQAFTEAVNRLTLDHPQACLNWMADQARIARGEQPHRDWSTYTTSDGRRLA